MQIGVIGKGGEVTEEEAKAAYVVGRLIATHGHVLICGGMGGVMEAAARGAKETGGLTVGIIPTYDHHDRNPYIDICICSGMGHARNVLVAASSNVLIAVGGETGTLSEIALGRKIGVPVVTYNSWTAASGRGFPLDVISATSPEEAVSLAIQTFAPKQS